jgi:hypothetical protein
MNLGTRLVAALALVGGLFCAAHALETEYRIWTTPDGTYSTEARLLDHTRDAVRLLRSDGKATATRLPRGSIEVVRPKRGGSG